MGPNNDAKCEMDPHCTRDSVGTVRLRPEEPRPGDDRQTCPEHTGGREVWYFGKTNPYRV